MRPTVGRAYQGKALIAPQGSWTGRWGSTLASGVAAGIAFGALAWAIRAGWTAGFDARISWAIHGLSGPWTSVLMVMLSTLADPVMAVAFSLWAAWIAFQQGDNVGSATAAVTVWVAGGLEFVFKHLFHRMRPDLWATPDPASGFGFPSWHTLAAVAVGGTIALVIGRSLPRVRLAVGLAVVALAIAVGFSRIYLGQHWPTDVLAGACVGWILLLAAASVLERFPFSPRPAR